VMKPGDSVEAKFVGVDKKKRTISLSIKAKEDDEEAAAMEEYSAASPGGTATFGDLMKEQLNDAKEGGS